MRDEVFRRVENRLQVIPYTGIFFSQYNHANDGNPDLVDGEINLEKLEVIAKLLRRFLGSLKYLRMNREIHHSQISLNTDLNQQLGNEVKEPEFDFWEASKKMKPLNIS